MYITLIRHAQSLGNADHTIYHKMMDHEIPLTEKGVKDAEKKYSSEKLYNQIYYSPYTRCVHTKNLLFGDSKGIENPLLIERQWGQLRNLVGTKNFDKKVHFNFFYRPQNGESFFDVYQRVALFFEFIKSRHSTLHNICIVSHGEWIKVACMYLEGNTVEDFHNDRSRITNLSERIKYFEF